MYFEPARKTYYRFPSTQSINKIDSKLYYPDKPRLSEEDSTFKAESKEYIKDREASYDL